MGEKAVLRARLAMFYDKHNPGKIEDVSDLAKVGQICTAVARGIDTPSGNGRWHLAGNLCFGAER